MMYSIEYAKKFPWKILKKIPRKDLQIILRAIEEKLANDPILFGKPLRYSLKGFRSLRVGEYRIIYLIEENLITIALIGNRSTVYELMESMKRNA